MKILIYVGHPAQYFFFRNTIKQLFSKKHDVVLLIKTKDVLENIVKSDGFKYINIMPQVRGASKIAIGIGLVKRNFRILPIILKEKPDLLIGGDPSISQLGWLLRKPRFTLTEDDYPVIKTLANLTFPFAQCILSPSICNVGRWEDKKVGYNGFMKLAYLHPDVFKPDKRVLAKYTFENKFVLIRIAQLTAHHDFGITGLRITEVKDIIKLVESMGYCVYISSENRLDKTISNYELRIAPSDIHHILAFATLLVSDSQSMSVEASMLGTPSIRYSDFAGKISVLEELEKNYNLTYGIKPGNSKELYEKIRKIITLIDHDIYIYKSYKEKMINDKIKVSRFVTWFIENYPGSKNIMKENPDYQYNFK